MDWNSVGDDLAVISQFTLNWMVDMGISEPATLQKQSRSLSWPERSIDKQAPSSSAKRLTHWTESGDTRGPVYTRKKVERSTIVRVAFESSGMRLDRTRESSCLPDASSTDGVMGPFIVHCLAPVSAFSRDILMQLVQPST